MIKNDDEKRKGSRSLKESKDCILLLIESVSANSSGHDKLSGRQRISWVDLFSFHRLLDLISGPSHVSLEAALRGVTIELTATRP